MLKIADLIDSNLDYLSSIESIDNGKPKKLAANLDIPGASSNFRFFATAALQFQASRITWKTVQSTIRFASPSV
jgi:aminomuconate-semialdehyde/2-hydroxymuconate-6-semialdehyde dehydrogenase